MGRAGCYCERGVGRCAREWAHSATVGVGHVVKGLLGQGQSRCLHPRGWRAGWPSDQLIHYQMVHSHCNVPSLEPWLLQSPAPAHASCPRWARAAAECKSLHKSNNWRRDQKVSGLHLHPLAHQKVLQGYFSRWVGGAIAVLRQEVWCDSMHSARQKVVGGAGVNGGA
jgi:hypothetical protein